ncbi:hypothetical protein [Thiomicrospira sp.]|uniref:lipopolysaccharide biosynthesis protein n=1 Tax=Thiomicrospira sp. TaxID=935 RepID=UPI002F932558
MYNLLHRLHDRLPINRDYLAALVTGYGLMAVIIVIQLVLIPLYLTHLGKEKFGVLAMIMVANNYAAIGITWLSGSMARVLAERAAVDDREGFREAYAFSKAVYVLYAVIALCIFWLAAPWLLKNALADEEIFYAIVLSSVYFVLAYEYNADRQAFMARHWQARGNLREVVGQIVFAGFVAFGLYQGMGLPGVVLAQIAGIVCTRLLAWAHWRKDEYGLGWAWKFTDARTLWRRVSGRVGRHYVVYGVLLLTLQADALIIGWLAGPEIAANYYLLWRIPEVFILLLWRIPSSYAPHLIAMDARHEYDSLSQNYRKGLYSVSILAGLAALIYGIFGNPIVHLWLGDDAPAGQLPYAIAALAMFFISIARWPAEVAYALMNTKPLVRVVAIELAFKLVLIAVLFSAIGYLSPIVAVCLVHLLGISYLYMWLGKETISAHIHSRII